MKQLFNSRQKHIDWRLKHYLHRFTVAEQVSMLQERSLLPSFLTVTSDVIITAFLHIFTCNYY